MGEDIIDPVESLAFHDILTDGDNGEKENKAVDKPMKRVTRTQRR